jgi:dTDP-4-dehydrorhamnose reductase
VACCLDMATPLREALIGYTGFVGSNLATQHTFSDAYNRSNIESIRGQSFDLVVSAGTPGVKFLANKEPEADWAAITQLMDALERVTADQFVLISSLNVYAEPRNVDETSPIGGQSDQLPYGRHRARLEQLVAEQFPHHLIVRLPGIFGSGLKKNFLYDLMQGDDRFLANMHVDSVVQLYDLTRLWGDIARAQEQGIRVLNLATEPVRVQDIARHLFNRDFPGRTDGPVYHDDIRSIHGALWGQTGPYLYSAHEVMQDLQAFVRKNR